MRKLFYSTAAAVAIAGSAFIAMGSTPANAAFCATNVDGQGIKGCYPTYASCARAISGAGGQCVANGGGGYGGYEDSYAYAPGPAYGTRYGYDDGPGYYRRPGVGIYIGGY